MVRLGFKRPLQQEDLWGLAESERPVNSAAKFKQHFKGSSWRALYQASRGDIWLAGFLYLLSAALRFVGPFMLGLVVRFVQQSARGQPTTVSLELAYSAAAIMFLSQVLSTLFHVHSDLLSLRVGIRSQDALVATAFERALSLSNASKRKTNTGTIMNLVANDAMFCVEFSRFLHQTWTAPLILIAGVVYIQILIGPSVWAGLSVLAAFAPTSYYLGKTEAQVQRDRLKHTDVRIKTANEALQGIRVVKVNAWEDSLQSMLDLARKSELKMLMKLENVRAVTSPLAVAVPNVACVIALMTYVSLGGQLVPASIFQVVSLFIIIRLPFVTLPQAISQFSRAKVMNERFDKFFSLEQRSAAAPSLLPVGSVRFERATLAWQPDGEVVEKEASLPQLPPSKSKASNVAAVGPSSSKDATEATQSQRFLLQDISLDIHPGEVVAVVGKVGAGKSSLCAAVLGDMTKEGGNVEVSGKAAYVGQEPFILNASLRENVMFGQPFDEPRYRSALRVSALERDVELLPSRDECEIGERGINLSGGQKARVSLARAVYANADVYILDDPLSAVDAHVGRFVLTECILGALQGKTRLLVTNNLASLPFVDRVVVLVDGKLAEVGSYAELVGSGGALAGMLQSVALDSTKDPEEASSVEVGLVNLTAAGTSANAASSTSPAPTVQTAATSQATISTAPTTTAATTTMTTTTTTATATPTPTLLQPQKSSRFRSSRRSTFLKSYSLGRLSQPISLDATRTLFVSSSRLTQTGLPVSSTAASVASVPSGKLHSAEQRSVGAIKRRVYGAYWLAGVGGYRILVFLLLLLFFVTEACYLATDSFLAIES